MAYEPGSILGPVTVPARGLTFTPDYPGILYELDDEFLDQDLTTIGGRHGVPVTLVREPENPVDPNAVAVHWTRRDGTVAKLGHVPAKAARWLARDLDTGITWHARAMTVRVRPDAMQHPGLDVVLTRPGAAAVKRARSEVAATA